MRPATFGTSAPLKSLLTKFGFMPGKMLDAAKGQIENMRAACTKAAAE